MLAPKRKQQPNQQGKYTVIDSGLIKAEEFVSNG
jgi:hypothetical protein